MLKKTLSIILVGSCIAAPSFASNFFKFGARDNQSLEAPKQKQSVNHTSHQFTDFSGTWKGICTNDEMREEEIITIKSNEYSFKVNEKVYYIGGALKSESFGSSWSTGYDHETLFWNEDKTQIFMNGVVVTKIHPEEVTGYTNTLSNTLIQAVVSMNNEKLVVEQKNVSFSGANKVDEESFVCTYTREEY